MSFTNSSRDSNENVLYLGFSSGSDSRSSSGSKFCVGNNPFLKI